MGYSGFVIFPYKSMIDSLLICEINSNINLLISLDLNATTYTVSKAYLSTKKYNEPLIFLIFAQRALINTS